MFENLMYSFPSHSMIVQFMHLISQHNSNTFFFYSCLHVFTFDCWVTMKEFQSTWPLLVSLAFSFAILSYQMQSSDLNNIHLSCVSLSFCLLELYTCFYVLGPFFTDFLLRKIFLYSKPKVCAPISYHSILNLSPMWH